MIIHKERGKFRQVLYFCVQLIAVERIRSEGGNLGLHRIQRFCVYCPQSITTSSYSDINSPYGIRLSCAPYEC